MEYEEDPVYKLPQTKFQENRDTPTGLNIEEPPATANYDPSRYL
jgi:hypothetical protein